MRRSRQGLPFPVDVNEPILVLLDIDGTLLDAAGQGRGAFHDALEELFPGCAFPSLSMAGRTDRGLWIQLSALVADRPVPPFESFVHRYAAILDRRLGAHPPRVLPGAAALLDALEADAGFHPGLVTGNIVEGTRYKLAHCGLWDVFERVGTAAMAFGGDAPDKGPLAREALDSWGRSAPAVLVGDTPEDIRCAHVAGIPCLAVATGGFDADVLRAHGAECVLPDLSDTSGVLAEIRRLARQPVEESA